MRFATCKVAPQLLRYRRQSPRTGAWEATAGMWVTARRAGGRLLASSLWLLRCRNRALCPDSLAGGNRIGGSDSAATVRTHSKLDAGKRLCRRVHWRWQLRQRCGRRRVRLRQEIVLCLRVDSSLV